MEKGKSLVILRHAKSSWDEEGKSDFDRVLKPRGITDIVKIASEVKPLLSGFNIIFSSSANRAIHTSILFAKTVGVPTEKIRIIDELYETNVVNLLNFVKSIPNELRKVVVVGHNPTSTDFVNLFIDEQIDNIPTSGLVKIDFNEVGWENISKQYVSNVDIRFP